MVTSPRNPDLTKQHASPQAGRTGIFQGLRSFLIKIRGFLERIKNFPWFGVLSLLMLTWGGYQVMTQPHSSGYAWVKQSIQRVEHTMRRAFVVNLNKQENLAKETPPSTIALDVDSPQKASSTVDFSIYDKKIVELEQRLEMMQMMLDEFQQTNDTLKKAMDDITSRFENIKKTPDTKVHPPAETTVALEKELTPESAEDLLSAQESHYSVHAVVQGRAWLNTKEGRMLTVNVGSQLPPFGTVQEIDADNRLVYFNDGHFIGPSANDS